MVTVIARIKLTGDEGAERRFLDAISSVVEATRAEDGCVRYELSQSNDTPSLFVVYERWEDQAALDRHRAAPHMVAFRVALAGDFAEPPALELLTAIS